MTRPKIWKEPRFGGRPWCATHPDKPSFWRLCETWQEAMEFVADKIVNPFPLELGHVAVTYEDGDVIIKDWHHYEKAVLEPRHWRPLARALTRLADKEGVK